MQTSKEKSENEIHTYSFNKYTHFPALVGIFN